MVKTLQTAAWIGVNVFVWSGTAFAVYLAYVVYQIQHGR